MATVADVLNQMPLSSSARNAADDIKAVNFAIAKSWPKVKLEEYATVGTLVSGTFEYALSALSPQPSRELGVAIAELDINDSQHPVVVRAVKQRYSVSDGYWTLIVDPRLCSSYSDRTMYVRYQYPHPLIEATTDTVYLNIASAGQIAALWYSHYLATGSTYDSAFNRAIAPEFYRAHVLQDFDITPQLPNMVPIVGKEYI